MAHTVEKVTPEQLQTIGIFESLSPAELADISEHSTLVRMKKRQTVYSPESADEAAYLLLDGKVKLFHMSDEGREIIVEILQAGDVFGEVQPMDAPPETWAETLDACRIALLPQDYFSDLLRAHPEVALRLVEEMSLRLQHRASQIEDLALRSVSARVANTLLKLGEAHGTMSRNGITIDLRLTHQDIANMVAASRETVTTVLVDMREHGVIEIERKYVRIANPAHLQVMAEFN
ncbi:MAG: Crp/Fnr family transcriptional regulator [Armatimonadota bacterium]